MATAYYAAAGRGMSVGSVLGRAFGVIGTKPVVFLGTSFLLAALPSTLFRLAAPAVARFAPADGNLFARLLPVLAIGLIGWMLFYLAAQAVLFRATAAQLDGRPEPFGGYVGAALRALLPLLGLSILMTLAVMVGWLLLLVPGIMLAVMWSVATPALVVERDGVFAALGRSRYLTRGARWRIFGLVVLVYAIYFIASGVLGLIGVAMGSLAAGAGAGAGSGTGAVVVATVLSVLLQTGFVAVWTAIQGVLYVELRDWKDGPAGDRLSAIFA